MTFENKHPSFFQSVQRPEENTAKTGNKIEKFGNTTATNAKILGCSQESSQFSKLFFSSKNVENVQKMIRYSVYNKTKDVIGPQSNTELLIVMKSTYLQYGRVPAQTSSYPSRIQELNERVVKLVVPGIVTAVEQYKGYLIDASKAPDFLDRPTNDSSTGTKELRSTTDVLFGTR